MENSTSEEENNNNVDLNDDSLEHHMTLVDAEEVEEEEEEGGGEVNFFSSDPQIADTSEPFVGMEFESEEAAKLYYMAYASRVGFSVRISKSRRSRNDESIIMRRFVCSKEGFHVKKGNFDNGKKKRRRATIREGCNAMIEVIQKYYGRWVVTKLVKEHNHVVEAPSRVRYIAPEEYADVEPFVGMEFPSHEAAQTFYYAYASRIGFDVRIRLSRRSTRDESFVMRRFVCTKEGFSPVEENGDDSKRKRNRTPTREGCKAMFEVIRKDYDRWTVSKLCTEHTHELAVAPSKVHYIQSQVEVVVLAKSGSIRSDKLLGLADSRPQHVQSFGGFNSPPFISYDCRTDTRDPRHVPYGLEESQKLIEHFKTRQVGNPTLVFSYLTDKNNCLTHAFWADAREKMAYFYFGDAVTFDTSYKENKNMMPFVMFTGVNHHLQSIMFGWGLLTDDSEESYSWLFQSWLMAMCGSPPVSLVTDHHVAVGAAVAKVFPTTRHRLNKWDILQKLKGTLSNFYITRPSFEADFLKCVNESETTETFELRWKSILNKYDLGENLWLQSLYSMRQKWVPAFCRDTFTAEVSVSHRPESLSKFFDKYFNTTTSLDVFAAILEYALRGWQEREALEDYATQLTRPILKTPSNMLKKVSGIYTRTVFNLFQEEFVESLGYFVDRIEDGVVSKYNVTKDEDAETTCIVTYESSESKTTCSCRKFETCGILCKHILRVFLTVDVRSIPEYYISRRWHAKNDIVGCVQTGHQAL